MTVAVRRPGRLGALLPESQLREGQLREGLPARGTAERAAVLMAAVSVALQPLLHPTGPLNSSPVDVTLLLTIVATAVWASGRSVRLRAPYVIPVALMVIGGAVAGLAGPLPGTSLVTLFQDLVLVTWATAVTNLAGRPGVLRLLSTTWALTSICYAAVLVAASLFGWTAVEGLVAREGNRALFTFGDPDYASTYWWCSLFVVYATQRPLQPWLRRLGYVLLVWSVVLTQSNGGLLAALPLGVALIVLAAVRRRFGTTAAVAALLAVVAVLGAALTVVPFSQVQGWARDSGQPLLTETIGRSDASSSQRGVLIVETLDLYATYGPLGYGPGTTKTLLGLRSYSYVHEVHDDYLAGLVERGVIGVTGVLLLVAAAVRRSARVLRGPPHGWRELPRPVGLVAALAATALAATYYEVLHFRFVWLLLAFTAAVAARWPERQGTGGGHAAGSVR